jgi:hypothetical protein
MTQANARSCGVSVAALMTASVLSSVPASLARAQPSNVVLLPGYSMTAVATGLNFPTAMTLQGDTIWVTEEGITTPVVSPPAVKQIDNKGNVTTKLTADQLPAGTLVSPLTGIVFHEGRGEGHDKGQGEGRSRKEDQSGWFYLVHRQTNSKNAPGVPVGVVSRFKASDPVGTFQTIISGFPSFGDHPNSQIVFDHHGRAYINGAAPTNSSVVGPDNRWAPSTPTLSDFPGVDIELSGIGYQTLIPFTAPPPPPTLPALDPAGGTTTALTTYPFVAFGAPLPPGNKVKAPTPANPRQGIIAGGGTVYSFDPDAANPTSTMRLEAWGFRNPYGIGIDPFNEKALFVSNNASDVRQTTIVGNDGIAVITIRGSRPIQNDLDDVFLVQIGDNQGSKGDQDSQGHQDSKGKDSNGKGSVPFFGHPDYFHDPVTRQPIPVTDSRFCPPFRALPTPPPPTLHSPCPQFAFSDRFRATLTVQPAFAEIPDNHGSANMFDFSRTKDFGFKGDIFIAETGSIPTGTGAATLTGFKVARIDRNTGSVTDFVTHPDNNMNTIFPVDSSVPPKPILGAFNKPIDVRFRDDEMFIVDFGVSNPATPTANSGKIWKVTHN